MTSNDVPASASGGAAGRRRALGRGPGAPPPWAAPEPDPPAAVSDPPPSNAAVPYPEPGTADPETAEPDVGPPDATGSEAPEPDAAAPGVRESGATGSDASQPDVWQPDAPPSDAPRQDGAGSGLPRTAVRGSDAAQPVVPEPDAAGRDPVVAGAGAAVAEGGPSSREASDGVFKVRLANFEGPFDLLLQLISKHKLDVTEVALSKVTDEFMAHIRAMGPDWDLDQTTEFLVVAATLLDLKAARLLPAAEVEDEADLALLEARDLLFARLLQYRAYKQIADIFTHRLESEGRRYPRTVGLEAHHAELLPEVVISIGAEGFAKLAVKAMQPRAKPQVYVDHIHAPLVSVQEQAGIVVARLRQLGEASFRALVEDTDDTLTVVARFLALLELYREKAVALDQETALGELLVRWTGGDGNAQPTVTDEFDRPPEEPGKETRT
ncbi:segregation/condensation protein A [Streptomyces sp. NPDC000658]|uniref:segregation and condensation protein A n=1 Tax=Streptomyces sp. NPDC000658 TaxID=3154266 RepID=UPI00332275CF